MLSHCIHFNIQRIFVEEFYHISGTIIFKPSIWDCLIALLLRLVVQRRKSKTLLLLIFFLQRISFSELPLLVISMLNLLLSLNNCDVHSYIALKIAFHICYL